MQVTLKIAVDTRPAEAAFRGMVQVSQQAAQQIAVQMRAALAGLRPPPLDFSGMAAAAKAAHEDVARVMREPVEVPVEPEVNPETFKEQVKEQLGPLEVPVVPEAAPASRGLRDSLRAPMQGLNESLFFLRSNVTQGLAQIGQTARAATAPFIDFEQRLASVNGLLDEGQSATVLYQQGLLQMVGATARPAADLADGLYQVVSAFGSNAETLGILEANARAATAGLSSTSEAIALTSAVTKAYGTATAEGVQQVADLAQTTAKLGQTTFPELAGSMGRVTPLAAQLKVSQEELFAVFATMTGVTGGAAEVATQYRGALQALLAPSADMEKLLKAQGFASGQAAIEQKGFIGTMQMVAAESEKSGKPLTDYIGSIEGVSLVLPLVGAQAGKAASNLEAMRSAAGASAAAFGRNTATLGMAIAGVHEQMEALRIQALSTGAGFLTSAVNGVGAMVGWVGKLPPGLQAAAIGFADLAKMGVTFAASVVAPMVTALPNILRGIKAVTAATYDWAIANRALQASAGIIGLLSLVVGAFVVKAIEAQEAAGDMGNAFEKMGIGASTASERVTGLVANLETLSAAQVQANITAARQQMIIAQASVHSLEADLRKTEEEALRYQGDRGVPGNPYLRIETIRRQIAEARREAVAAGTALYELEQAAVRHRQASPSTLPPTATPRTSSTDARTAAQDAASAAARLQAQLDEARARSTDIAHEREIAAIADEGERRRREIDETEQQQKATADRALAATLARLDAEKVAGERRELEEALAGRLNLNAHAEAEAAREKALAALARDEAERTARLDASLLGVRQQNERTALERRHSDERAAITDEGERRAAQIRQTYEQAEQAAQQKRDADLARIDATAVSEAVKERERTVVRQQYEAAIGQAEQARIGAAREAQADADREHMEQVKARIEEQVQALKARLGSMADVLSGGLSEALTAQQRQSQAEVALQRRAFDEQERSLKESLAKRRISQEEYDLRVRKLAEDRAAYEKGVDEERAGVAVRVAKNLTAALLAEGQRWLVQKIVQYTAEALAHAAGEKAKTMATATGTAARTGFNLGEIGSALLNAGSSMVAAAGAAIRSVAAWPFPANVIAGGAAVAGLVALFTGVKNLMGFATGGYTGPGERDAPAGIVHRGEFVFTKAQVGGDPRAFYALAQMLNRGWTMDRVLSIGGLQGYATGGYVSPASVAGSSAGTASVFDDSRLVAATTSQAREMAALRRDVQALAARPVTYVVGDADARRQTYAARREARRVDPARRL